MHFISAKRRVYFFSISFFIFFLFEFLMVKYAFQIFLYFMAIMGIGFITMIFFIELENGFEGNEKSSY